MEDLGKFVITFLSVMAILVWTYAIISGWLIGRKKRALKKGDENK